MNQAFEEFHEAVLQLVEAVKEETKPLFEFIFKILDNLIKDKERNG